MWSPDGRSIGYFAGTPVASSRLMVQPASSVGAATGIVTTSNFKQLTDWGLDGKTLVFEERNAQTGWDLSVVDVDAKRDATPVLRTRFDERLGQLSPDGRFLAYVSNETGREEVYVVTFPDVVEKWPVSSAGGSKPRWRRDGSELFFVTPSGTLMSATTTLRPSFHAQAARTLFDLGDSETIGNI